MANLSSRATSSPRWCCLEPASCPAGRRSGDASRGRTWKQVLLLLEDVIGRWLPLCHCFFFVYMPAALVFSFGCHFAIFAGINMLPLTPLQLHVCLMQHGQCEIGSLERVYMHV